MTLEELFGMRTGYVLEFTNNSFEFFIKESIGINIYSDKGYEYDCSKANKLRQIWDNESNYIVGKLTTDLLDECEDIKLKSNKITEYDKKQIKKMRDVAHRLIDNSIDLKLPANDDNSVNVLLDDINKYLEKNQPEFALDRLHTVATKIIRNICVENNVDIKNDKDQYLPLHSLVGAFVKKYDSINLFESQFAITAIKNSISVFEKFNKIRNDKSYAHDNIVLNSTESEFVVRIMVDLLNFIIDIEKFRKDENINK